MILNTKTNSSYNFINALNVLIFNLLCIFLSLYDVKSKREFMKIFFITPYPLGKAASQRFRFEQYFSLLKKNGIEFKVAPFLDEKTWSILYKKGFFFQKVKGIIKGYLRRLFSFLSIYQYDYVFIHREILPIGPPFTAWILCKLFRKKVIFDFDDAIWIPNASEHNRIMHYFKFYSNTAHLCRMAYKVSCGNKYLQRYARQFNKNAIYNPTTIDTENYHNKIKDQKTPKFIIGWTGTHSTINYLNELLPIFKKLEKKYDFELHVISDKNPNYDLKSMIYIPWCKDTEIDDLLAFNIGLMPLPDDRWAKGKCGFKALQYMALGIPALVSPVGVNSEIVDQGVNGFICNNLSEWEEAIIKLIESPALLEELSKKTRSKIEKYFSAQSNSENFLNLFS
jgi:glycosyltransferase involved in cell wall biosynthesis